MCTCMPAPPKEEALAWLYLFECMDKNEYYLGLDGDEVDAYKAAKGGSVRAVRWLLEMRIDCEYERVTIEHPVEP